MNERYPNCKYVRLIKARQKYKALFLWYVGKKLKRSTNNVLLLSIIPHVLHNEVFYGNEKLID